MFRQSVSEILGGAESAPPGCEMGPKSPALLGLNHNVRLIFSVKLKQAESVLFLTEK